MASELGNEFMNADGIINYEVANGFQNIGNQYNENYMSADGDSDDFYDADGDNDEFYNAGGRKKGKSGFAKFWSYTPLGMLKDGIDRRNSPEGLARRDARKQQRLDIRKSKVEAKQTLANAQVESAKQMGKGSEADLELAKSLGKNAEQPTEKGLSKGMKIGVAVGVVLILGVVGFIVYKKMSAKK